MRASIAVLAILAVVTVCPASADLPTTGGPSAGRTITVDDDGAADFSTIQAAIDDSNDGDTVLVADGTYTGDGNRDIDFHGKAITVKSENGPETCIIDCNGTEYVGHRGFYFHSGEDANSAIIGFTITNGYADDGGGLYCIWSSPLVESCRFVGNRASSGYGGGVRSLAGEGALRNCAISDNTAAICGGGIALYNCRMRIENCIIFGNTAERYYGGGIYLAQCGSQVRNCTVVGNFAGQRGGGLRVEGDVVVTNCIIRGNTAVGYPAYAEISSADSSAAVSVAYSNIEGGYSGMGNIDVDPCFAEAGCWDSNGTPDDVNDDFFIPGDYHLKSQGGRYDPNSQTWLTDEVASPCIDAGDQMSPIGLEPFPNGGRVNMGAYGGTAEASKSYFGEAPCETIVAGDINGDCSVNFLDLRIMALHWLWVGGDTPVNSNSIVKDCIEYYMQTDKSVYRLGENVEMLYRVTNLGDEDVTFRFGNLQQCYFEVNDGETPVWGWPQRVNPAISFGTLRPGESMSYYKLWSMLSDSGVLIIPGIYYVSGELISASVEASCTDGPLQDSVSVAIEVIP